MALIKRGAIGKKPFERILAEFAPKFNNVKPLARELRSVLFPFRDDDHFVGTLNEHEIMYDGMDMAFNTAIGRWERRNRQWHRRGEDWGVRIVRDIACPMV